MDRPVLLAHEPKHRPMRNSTRSRARPRGGGGGEGPRGVSGSDVIDLDGTSASPPWVATVFDKHDPMTDFAYLAGLERRTLFIFNDNEENFPHGTARGGGNACVRSLRGHTPPRAAGIPTGTGGQGYASLTPPRRAAIDAAFGIIDWLTLTGRYDRVRYCCTKSDSFALGSGIFKTCDAVHEYIRSQIFKRASGTHACAIVMHK